MRMKPPIARRAKRTVLFTHPMRSCDALVVFTSCLALSRIREGDFSLPHRWLRCPSYLYCATLGPPNWLRKFPTVRIVSPPSVFDLSVFPCDCLVCRCFLYFLFCPRCVPTSAIWCGFVLSFFLAMRFALGKNDTLPISGCLVV